MENLIQANTPSQSVPELRKLLPAKQGLVGQIVIWAEQICHERGLRFIRLDTVGDNEGLIRHYTHHGFTFLGSDVLKDVGGLPSHYAEDVVLRFEIDLLTEKINAPTS